MAARYNRSQFAAFGVLPVLRTPGSPRESFLSAKAPVALFSDKPDRGAVLE